MPKPDKDIQTARARDIRSILGPDGAGVIRDILETGADPAEVQAALAWLESDDYMGKTLPQLHPRTLDVYEILRSDREDGRAG